MPSMNGFTVILVDANQLPIPETIVHSSNTFLGVRIQTEVATSPCAVKSQSIVQSSTLSKNQLPYCFSIRIDNTGIDPSLFERGPEIMLGCKKGNRSSKKECSLQLEHDRQPVLRVCVVVIVNGRLVFAHTLRSRHESFDITGCRTKFGVVSPLIFSGENDLKDEGYTTKVSVELWHCKAQCVDQGYSLWDDTVPCDPKATFLANELYSRLDTKNDGSNVLSLECKRLGPHPLLSFDIRGASTFRSDFAIDSWHPLSCVPLPRWTQSASVSCPMTPPRDHCPQQMELPHQIQGVCSAISQLATLELSSKHHYQQQTPPRFACKPLDSILHTSSSPLQLQKKSIPNHRRYVFQEPTVMVMSQSLRTNTNQPDLMRSVCYADTIDKHRHLVLPPINRLAIPVKTP
ncbi:hypothetical protein BATDEDRAFT_90251 [Batrachochytrium dendrobatidis JAM81]|uniref:Uncharacterized protein n=2 Tax=Batrachochytrium dendrobatidis TaxID=109871 RepID=F4P733_BATDJ|nr:uncharacterized protein BATDEDRAFT_90251 [Batrachochytrium dendrobatidis JAM81]EGF78794.1 hypothetical protein BATDEDRAFT_90251 [Batrachochytrium dendrobatidis JAM81]|eukprot:XP_006680454.1 hypothetical protein BATDEDRAFT_90251 [Batrachochytrium dendrobatidis JAM81]